MDVPPWLDTLVDQMMAKDPAHRPVDASMVVTVLDEVKAKVEAREMAGMDVAKGVARRNKGKDRDAADVLLRSRKKRRGKRRVSTQKLATGIALTIALVGLLALIAWAVWPEGQEARLQRRFQEGQALVQEADQLVEAGDEGAAKERLYDARDKLVRVAGVDGSPLAGPAKELLNHVDAGRLYLLGSKHLAGVSKDWRAAKTSGLDELLDRYPATDLYVEKARKLLEPHEAPALLKQARKLLEADLTDKERDEALMALDLLGRRYPDSEAARAAQVVAAEQEIRELLRKKRAGETLPGELNRAKDLAMDATELEENKEVELAAAKWEEITRLPADNVLYAPWIALAQERLARLKK
jgi:hypothetical protein